MEPRQPQRPAGLSSSPPLSGTDPLSARDDDLTAGMDTLDREKAKRASKPEIDLRSASASEAASDPRLNKAYLFQRGKMATPGYRVVSPLGRGTYGEVWLAHDEATGVKVAVKFFAHKSSARWQALQDEVKQLASLDGVHGIVQIYDVSHEAELPYYVMQFAEKGSLAEKLDVGTLPVAVALPLFRQLAEALSYVHAKGICHCDLKPGNVLLDARDKPLLGDFGQAHLADDASLALGTYFYMAPEQATLEPQLPDTRWDVYGLGAVLYVMLTGRPPREDPDVRKALKHTTELGHRLKRYRDWLAQAPPPAAHRSVQGVDPDLAAVIDRCLHVDPAQRFHDAHDVLAALDRRERRRRERPLVRFGLLAPVALLVLVALLALLGVGSALSYTQNALTKQVQTNDLFSAHLVANVVRKELQSRVEPIEKDAQHPQLRQLVSEALDPQRRDDAKSKLAPLLKKFHDEKGRDVFRRWNVADRDGFVLATEPVIEFEDVSYSWRDWFNGTGNYWDARHLRRPPVAAPHISQPDVALTRDDKDSYMRISVSVPIRDPDGNAVVGVLTAGIDLAKVHDWLTGEKEAQSFAVLINERGQLLLHEDRAAIMPRQNQTPPDLTASSPLKELCLGLAPDCRTLPDPLSQDVRLASYAPVGMDPEWLAAPAEDVPYRDWHVVILHDPETVEGPIGRLKQQVLVWTFATAAVVGLVCAGLWGWLLWTLRRREHLAHG